MNLSLQKHWKHALLSALLSVLATFTYAGKPLFLFTPLTATSLSVPINGAAEVQYTVTNNSIVPRTLTMVPIVGITQHTGSTGECARAFFLVPTQSCVLTLQLDGSQLPDQVTHGPVVCKTKGGGNTNPDPFLCAQPALADSLNITRVGTESVSLSVSPASFTLTAAGSSNSFTIINHSSTVTALNIVANLTGTALDGNVTQNATDCTSVAPGQSCTLTFTPGNEAVTLASFPIQGDNTSQVGAAIAIITPTEATISIAGSPLILQGTTGTPVAGTITVTNESPVLTATNIAATLTGTALEGEVTQDATDCVSVNPGDSCTLSFTPGSNAVSTTSVIIQGDNTSETTATIAVNAAPEASIEITEGSPLALTTSGSAGTMTIQNNSPTEVATNITANFTGTALNGFVSESDSTCGSVNPGDTCTLTFSPETTVVSQTNFPIQGDNTTAITGAISVMPHAYVANNNNETVSICQVNTDGSIANCNTQTHISFREPKDIVINDDISIAYVLNSANNTISICTMDSNITLGSCTVATSDTFSLGFGGLYLNNGFLYVTNYPNDTVSICPINMDGSLGTCDTSDGNGTISGPSGRIGFNPSGTRLYVANWNNDTVSICPVNLDGSLGTCDTSGGNGTFADGPTGAVVSPDGLTLYVENDTTISICPISENGLLGICTSSTGNGTIYTATLVANPFISNQGTGYFPNIVNSDVSICPIIEDGLLGTCVVTNGDSTFDGSTSVWLR